MGSLVKVSDQAKTKRERSKETYEEIIKIARELFNEQGYNGTGVAQIVAKAGVTNAALYYYVSSKQELLYRVLEDGMADQLEKLERIYAASEPAAQRLEGALNNHFDLIFHRPTAIRVFLRERRFLQGEYAERYQERVKRYDMLFERIVADGVASGEFAPCDPRLMRLAILGMVNWVTEWYHADGPATDAEIRSTYISWAIRRLLGRQAT